MQVIIVALDAMEKEAKASFKEGSFASWLNSQEAELVYAGEYLVTWRIVRGDWRILIRLIRGELEFRVTFNGALE